MNNSLALSFFHSFSKHPLGTDQVVPRHHTMAFLEPIVSHRKWSCLYGDCVEHNIQFLVHYNSDHSRPNLAKDQLYQIRPQNFSNPVS